MKRILYIYPMTKRVSFTVVAKTYIEALRSLGYEVDELDANYPIPPDQRYDACILHPVIYPMLKYPRTFRRVLQKCDEWLGFDVCDSDHITSHTSYALSLFDRLAVPSYFCMETYKRSGVTSRIYIVPHHLDDAFLRDDIHVNSEIIEKVRSLPGVKVLFFLWHSWFRKGADVVLQAWEKIRDKVDATLIVKSALHPDPFIDMFLETEKCVVVDAWLDREELVALYDAVDIVLVPSRGGGFELNALEALARGRVTIISSWYPIMEYCHECLKIRTRAWCRVFDQGTMEGLTHDGYGVDPDPDHLAELLLYAIEHLDELRPIFKKARERVRRQYSFEAIKPKLIDFIEGR